MVEMKLSTSSPVSWPLRLDVDGHHEVPSGGIPTGGPRSSIGRITSASRWLRERGVLTPQGSDLPRIGTSLNSPGRTSLRAARISSVRRRTYGHAVDSSTTIANRLPVRFCW